MILSSCSVVRHNPAIVFTDLDDIIVMMDVDEGCYHELDPIGAKIWKLIEKPRPVADICERLSDDFEVTPDACLSDVLAYLNQALELGIIVAADGEA